MDSIWVTLRYLAVAENRQMVAVGLEPVTLEASHRLLVDHSTIASKKPIL